MPSVDRNDSRSMFAQSDAVEFASPQSKQQLREELEQQMEEFLSAGGKVDDIPTRTGEVPNDIFNVPLNGNSTHIKRRAQRRNRRLERLAFQHHGKGILSGNKSGYYGIYPVNGGRQYNVVWHIDRLGTVSSIEEALEIQHKHIQQLIKEGKIRED